MAIKLSFIVDETRGNIHFTTVVFLALCSEEQQSSSMNEEDETTLSGSKILINSTSCCTFAPVTLNTRGDLYSTIVINVLFPLGR